MTEPALDKLNPLLTSYIEQHRLIKSKERELKTLKEQLNELANKTIPKALTELGVASVKIDEGLQVAEFKPYREQNDQMLEPLYFYVRYWTSGGKSWHAPEISIEMEKSKPSMTCADSANSAACADCADCAHYDNCSLRAYIPALNNSNGGIVIHPQLIDVIKNAPKDCPRIENGEFAAVTFCNWLYSVLFSEAANAKPHRMPCEENR